MAGPYSGTAGSVVLVSGGTTLVGWVTEWSLDKSAGNSRHHVVWQQQPHAYSFD